MSPASKARVFLIELTNLINKSHTYLSILLYHSIVFCQIQKRVIKRRGYNQNHSIKSARLSSFEYNDIGSEL